jgi:hypothetical protein
MKKLFIVRKYIKAKSAEEAIKLDKTTPVEDCFLDEEYRLRVLDKEVNNIGFIRK